MALSETSTVKKKDMSFSARFLHGATFLTFEHSYYFALVAVIPVLLFLGASYAVGMWTGKYDLPHTLMWPPEMNTVHVETAGVGVLVAALFVLAAKMSVLRRRLAAEYVKRTGYTARVAYKLPVYGALFVLVTLSMLSFVMMLGVVINSLLALQQSGADIGDMYVRDFVPALMGFAIFSVAAWYVLWFAKGKDSSRLFVASMNLLAAVVVIALLVTALTINREGGTKSGPTLPSDPMQIEPYPMHGGDGYMPY